MTASNLALTLVIDAFNVIGSRPNGWWRDRDGAVLSLAERLQRLTVADSLSLILVVDGRPLAGLPEGTLGGVRVLYASRRGQNAADDRIIELIEASPDPASLEVVTSDRELSRRVRALGSAVSSPIRLLERLDEIAP